MVDTSTCNEPYSSDSVAESLSETSSPIRPSQALNPTGYNSNCTSLIDVLNSFFEFREFSFVCWWRLVAGTLERQQLAQLEPHYYYKLVRLELKLAQLETSARASLLLWACEAQAEVGSARASFLLWAGLPIQWISQGEDWRWLVSSVILV